MHCDMQMMGGGTEREKLIGEELLQILELALVSDIIFL